jgi:hypothetical protein
MDMAIGSHSPLLTLVGRLIPPLLVSALVWVLCRPSLPARPFLGGLALVPLVVSGVPASLRSVRALRSYPPTGRMRALLISVVWDDLWPALAVTALISLVLLVTSAALHHRRHDIWPPSHAVRALPMYLLSGAVLLQVLVISVSLGFARPLPYSALFLAVANVLTAMAYASLALLLAAVVASYRPSRAACV